MNIPALRIDAFTQGYVEAALREVSGACEPCQGNGEVVTDWARYLGPAQPGDTGDEGAESCPACDGIGARSFAFADIAPETQAAILADCAYGVGLFVGTAGAIHGAEFWMRRQRGDFLQFPRSAHLKPLTITLGDDGKVYLKDAAQ